MKAAESLETTTAMMIYRNDRKWLHVWARLRQSKTKSSGVEIHYESGLVVLWISLLTFSGLLTISKAANERWIWIRSPQLWLNGHIDLLSETRSAHLFTCSSPLSPHPSWCTMTFLLMYEIYIPKCQEYKNINLLTWSLLSLFYPFHWCYPLSPTFIIHSLLHCASPKFLILFTSFIFHSTSPFCSPSSSHHHLPVVQAEFVLLGPRHHRGRLRVYWGHGLPESTEEAAGRGEASPGYGKAHGQDAGGGGETESQEVTSGWPGQ